MNSDFDASSYPAHGAVLVVGDNPDAMARGAAAAAAADLPLAGRARLAEVESSLGGPQPPTRLFVEIDGVLSGEDADRLDRVLAILNSQADRGQVAAVVSTPFSLVDAVAARLLHPCLLQLADADDAERGAALAAAVRPAGATVRDSGSGEAARATLPDRRSRPDRRGAGPPVQCRADARLPRLGGGRRSRLGGCGGDRAHRAGARLARPSLRPRLVRRSGVGHAARPHGRAHREQAGGGIQPVHRRRRARDHRAALDPHADRCRPVRPKRRPARRRRVFIDLSDPAAAAMRAYLAALRAPAP
jgi:hypothetical protein